MALAGVIETRPGDDDSGAITLMRMLATKSRKRWPVTALPNPRLCVPAPIRADQISLRTVA
jgi:hypothetical protein